MEAKMKRTLLCLCVAGLTLPLFAEEQTADCGLSDPAAIGALNLGANVCSVDLKSIHLNESYVEAPIESSQPSSPVPEPVMFLLLASGIGLKLVHSLKKRQNVFDYYQR
jgi:hypothetical protein